MIRRKTNLDEIWISFTCWYIQKTFLQGSRHYVLCLSMYDYVVFDYQGCVQFILVKI